MPLGWVAGAIALDAGVQAYDASQAHGIASDQLSMEKTTFAEQQGFEKQLEALIANPSSVTSLPGYNFLLDQGSEARAREMAAGGFLNSGNEAAALTQYGQGLASSFYTTQANLLASLAGLAPASPAQYGAGATAANASASSQYSNLFGELGLFAGLYKGGAFASAGTPAAGAAAGGADTAGLFAAG